MVWSFLIVLTSFLPCISICPHGFFAGPCSHSQAELCLQLPSMFVCLWPLGGYIGFGPPASQTFECSDWSLTDSIITLLNDSNVCLLSQSSLEIGTHSGCFLPLLQLCIYSSSDLPASTTVTHHTHPLVVQSLSHVRLSCNPMNCSLPGTSIPGISQARILECVAISFSKGSFWPRGWTWVYCLTGGFFTSWATREALYHLQFAFS